MKVEGLTSDDFELEPLLKGDLVQSFNSLTIFTCKVRDLRKVIDENHLRTLLQSLSAVRNGLVKQKINGEVPTIILVSDRQPAIRGQKIGIYKTVKLVSASPTFGDLNPIDKVRVVLSSDIVEPETIFQLKNPPLVRFNTDLPKLKLRVIPTEFLILSEPFVINEEWGYNPVFEVEVPSRHRYYITPNRSLRDIFESSRRVKDPRLPPTIVGNLFRVWKKSEDKNSGFAGLEIQQFSDSKTRSVSKTAVVKNRAASSRTKAEDRAPLRSRQDSRVRKPKSGRCGLCRQIVSYHIVCIDGSMSDKCPVFVH